MAYTNLSAHALYDPDSAKKKIMDAADTVDYETRPLAVALNVSYSTVLRVLIRLGLRAPLRAAWLARRREKKALGGA